MGLSRGYLPNFCAKVAKRTEIGQHDAALTASEPATRVAAMASVRTDVAIAGGGMVGLTLALALAQGGLEGPDCRSDEPRPAVGRALRRAGQRARLRQRADDGRSRALGASLSPMPSRSTTSSSATASWAASRRRSRCISIIARSARCSATSSRTATSGARSFARWKRTPISPFCPALRSQGLEVREVIHDR